MCGLTPSLSGVEGARCSPTSEGQGVGGVCAIGQGMGRLAAREPLQDEQRAREAVRDGWGEGRGERARGAETGRAGPWLCDAGMAGGGRVGGGGGLGRRASWRGIGGVGVLGGAARDGRDGARGRGATQARQRRRKGRRRRGEKGGEALRRRGSAGGG